MLLAPALLTATPSATAASHELTLCGQVVNAAGWPLAGVHVNATPADHFSAIDFVLGGSGTVLHDQTDAAGYFELRLVKAGYSLAFSDPAVVPTEERYGALYAPQVVGVNLAGRDAVADACGGAPGFRLGGVGIALASPGQAFIALTVADGAADGTPGLAGVDVYPALLPDASDGLHVHTDENGVARMACAASAPLRVLLERDGYVDALHTATCPASGGSATSLSMWRRFAEVHVFVNDTAGAIAGATVRVAQSPDGMQAFAAGDAACGAVATTNHVLIDNGASPYVCEAVTTSGVAKLRLPWVDESGDAAYKLSATKDGFVTASTDVPLMRGETALGQTLAVARKSAEILVAAQTIEVTGGPITDVHGPIEGASVQFAPGLVATTGASGMFTITAPTGAHSLAITAAGKQARTCAATVTEEDGAGVLTLTDTRADCYRLTSAGKALVAATIRDRYTLAPAVSGVQVCNAGGVHCNTTNDDGLTLIEMANNEVLTIPAGPSALWTFDGMPASTFTISGFSAGGLFTKTFDLPRANRTVELLVQKDEATPLEHATIRVTGPPDQTVPEGQATYSNVTGPTGRLTIPLRWTSVPSHPEFDLPPFVISARLHNASEHFDLTASAPVNISSADATHPVKITMDPEGVVDMAVTVTDAHTGAALDGAIVTATVLPAIATDTCGPVCVDHAPAKLELYAGHRYKVCVMMPGYETTASVACAADIAPGPALSFNLKRNISAIAVTVTDPHTGLPVQGAKVHAEAADGFVCAPTGMPTNNCATAATTSATGAATIRLPWHTLDELCVVTDAGAAKAVVTASGTIAVVTEDVAFQPSEACPGLVADAASSTLALRPLRAGAAITGTLVGALDGEAVEDASVVATLVDPTLGEMRPGFVCDPAAADHDTPDGAFPDCAGVGAPDGALSLTLPAGHVSQRHLWTLTVDAPEHFEDVYTLVQAPRTVALKLYPESFEVLVIIEDAQGTTTHPCEGGMLVFFRDLESDQAYPAQLAQPRPDADTCIAKFDVPTWSRGAPARPLEAAEWPKSGSEFAIVAADGLHAGATVARLGPGHNVTELRASHVNPSAPSITSHVAHGIVRDASMIRPAGEAPTNGVSGATVTATRQGGACDAAEGGATIVETRTGAGGAYLLHLPCAGTYSIAASHAWYSPAAVQVSALAGLGPTAVPDLMLARRDVQLTIAAQLADGSPIGGVDVALTAADIVSSASATTDADGKARFVVPWGTYTTAATPPDGFVTAPTMPAPALPEQTNAYTYLVVEEPEAGHAVLRGDVTDRDSIVAMGIAGATVVATRAEGACADGRQVFSTTTGPAGAFALVVACPGTYVVTTTAARYHDGAPSSVTVAPGVVLVEEALSIGLDRVEEQRLVAVRDIVTSRGLSDVPVRVFGKDVQWESPTLRTGDTGYVALTLPWGAYDFVLEAPADAPDYRPVPGGTTVFVPASSDCATIPCGSLSVYMVRPGA